MGAFSVWIAAGLLCFATAGPYPELSYPVQVHLSYTENPSENPSEMTVTWTTFDYDERFPAFVEYGLEAEGMQHNTLANTSTFSDSGSLKRLYHVHRAIMTGLHGGKRYIYHVGSRKGISDLFSFQAMRTDPTYAPRFAVYGDMGNINPQSLSRLQEETQKGLYDAILHIGDFAYNLESENGTVGDSFMSQIQSIAAYVPYMVCPGNHEMAANFSHYKNRFTMPNWSSVQNMFYSINIGPAHVISYNTEVYYWWEQYGIESIRTQLNWLKKDLAAATSPENLLIHPWIIVMAHRPMYCSNNDGDCPKSTESGDRPTRYFLERLFCEFGVDLHLYAHEHSYERLWPVFNSVVLNGTASPGNPYTDPQAPVHVVTGSAGCQEKIDPFWKRRPAWSAFRSSDYGYARMQIHNFTHLSIEQVSDDQGGRVIDQIMIKKSTHGPGTYKC